MSIIGSLINNGGSGGGGSGTVTVTGPTPTNGNLTEFSGPTSIADSNVSASNIMTLETNSIQTVNSLTGNAILVLAAGSNVSVGQVSGSGTTTVTYNIPQSVSTGATPTFAQVLLAGNPTTNLQTATKQYVDGLIAGNLSIQGTWNATTNTPTLADGIGTVGYAYIVNVAGSQNLGHGIIAYNVGDTVFYTIANIWDVIPAGNTVISVNGQQGIVSLALNDLSDVIINTPLSGEVVQYNGSNWVNIQLDYTDLSNLPTLGTAAALNVGTSNSNIPQLGLTGLPAVSGQNLTGLTSAQVGLGNVPNIDTTNATNITSGTLPVAQLPLIPLNKGGTNANITANNGGIPYSNATQLQLLAGTATANQLLQSGSNAAPTWSTATYPSTTTANQLLYSSSINTITGLTSNNSSVLVTNGSGIPSLSTTLPAVNASSLTGITPTQVGLSNVPNVDATNASNITTGTLSSAQLPIVPLTKGGTNANITASNGGIVYSNATQLQVLTATATANQLLLSGSSTTPAWSTATYPATTTANQLLYSSSANTVGGLVSANNSILVTNGSGIPSLSTTLPAVNGSALTGLTSTQVGLSNVPNVDATNATNITTGTLPSAQLPIVPLNKGGTNAALTANNGGIAYSNASQLQILAGTATANQMLQSGSSTTPSWSTTTYPATTTANQLLYSSATNVVGGLSSANNSVLVTNGSGVPSLSSTLPAITIPSITFNTTSGLIGTTTNNNAAAGSVGEFISSLVLNSSPVGLSNNTPGNITSISLTAGDWDVWGNLFFTIGGTCSFLVGWVSSTSSTQPDASLSNVLSGTAVTNSGFSVPQLRFSLASTTTIYLSATAVFSSSTVSAAGGIYARRVR